MKKSLVQLVLTVEVDESAEEFETQYHPNLLDEQILVLRNLFGDQIQLVVQDMSILASENLEEDIA